MRETIRWVSYFVLAVIVTVSVVFAAYRIRGPSHAQREALALMQKDYRPKEGTNAFPLLWYVEYDVPDAEIAPRFAREIAAFRAALDSDEVPIPYEPHAAKLAEAKGDPSRLCELRAGGCLANVTADPAFMRATLATYPVMSARDKRLATADYYWNDFPVDSRAVPVAVPQLAQRVWLSEYALEYADGHRSAALADTCGNLDAWRRMHRGTNSLVGSMTAIAFAQGATHLFADMLAALPAGEPVPDACTHALRPIEAADVDRCAEMAGEFAFSRRTFEFTTAPGDRSGSWRERLGWWITLAVPQWEGWIAEQEAYFCEDPPVSLLADEPRPASQVRVIERLECISSLNGCLLADIAPAYADYDTRTLDYAAHLRLAASLLWLRETTSAKPLAQRFAERPNALRSGTRNSGYDATARMLFVDNLWTGREGRFTLPVADANASH